MASSHTTQELHEVTATLGVAAVFVAVGLSVVLVYALRSEAVCKAVTYGALGAQIALSFLAGCYFSAQGYFVWGGILCFVYCLIFSLCVWCYQSQLRLCCKLLSVAATALVENLQLVPATLAVLLIGSSLCAPLVYFCVRASRVGVALANPNAQPSPSAPGTCVAPINSFAPAPAPSAAHVGNAAAEGFVPADCCVFATTGGAIAYIVFAALFMMWTLFILFEVRSYICARVTALWYHQAAGSPLPGSPITDSLQLAVGPASGSLCMGGAVLTVAELLRMLANAVQNEEQGPGLMCLLEMIVSSLLYLVAELLAFMTRFATIRISITGEAFMDGASRSADLFKRNLLNSVAVWSFPPMVLHLLCFTAALAFALVALAIISLDMWGLGVVSVGMQLAVFFISLAIFWLPLSYVSCILLNVVDTVYYCYATDVDRHAITRREVHELFPLVPGIVVQPDDGVGLARAF